MDNDRKKTSRQKSNSNLKPIQKGQLSNEELKKRQVNGGKRSAEVRKQTKMFKQILEEELNKTITSSSGKKITRKQALTLALVHKAINGDVRAFEAIRDQLGETPTKELEITGDLGAKTVYVTKSMKKEADSFIDDVISKAIK